ncbi:membrane protein insertion efficiency factor YidD [bacterium]|nr:membrane protein insertion efficiency factor YidD [bacterium]
MNLQKNDVSSEKFFKILWLVKIEVFLIRNIYQKLFSPWLGKACRFQPTCSKYGIEVLNQYGFFIGNFKMFWRILRCNPFCRGGYDPA